MGELVSKLLVAILIAALARGILLALAAVGVDLGQLVATALLGLRDPVVAQSVAWIVAALAGLAFFLVAPPVAEIRVWLSSFFGRPASPTAPRSAAPAHPAPIMPDWPIREVFFYLDPRVTEDDGRRPSRWESVGNRIRSALASGLRSWGREGWGANAGPLVPIDQRYWIKGAFTYTFFWAESDNPHTTPPEGEPAYSDIQLNRSLALTFFPAPGADDASGEWRGQRFVYANPRQVFTAELLHDDDENEHYVLITDIDASASVLYSIETDPEKGDWRFGLGLDRSAFETADGSRDAGEATLDERGGVKLFVKPATKPGSTRVRVLIHSWTKPG